jgi:hypothetical protein
MWEIKRPLTDFGADNNENEDFKYRRALLNTIQEGLVKLDDSELQEILNIIDEVVHDKES